VHTSLRMHAGCPSDLIFLTITDPLDTIHFEASRRDTAARTTTGRGSVLRKGKGLPLLHSDRAGSRVHPASHPKGARDFFPRGKVAGD
jgi:hypothetical protein